MKIAFFGTPEFAVPTLLKISKTKHEIEVFTQPDKPVGRKAILTPSPVKKAAISLGLKVHQFEKIRSQEGIDALRAFAPDLYCVVAFGQLFSEENLSIPPLGAINVHGSILPQYRGASPIQQTVIDGLPYAGVSTMKLVKKMDAGDILLSRTIPLGCNETFGEVFEKLSYIGADLFMETLTALEAGELHPVQQNENEATYCSMLTRESGKIDFQGEALKAHNLIRGTNPWPGAYAILHNDKIKIWKSCLNGNSITRSEFENFPNGAIITKGKSEMYIKFSDNLLQILELQAPGGKRMSAADFLRGHNLEGEILQ